MATYSQTPGTLNLTLKSGDSFGTVIDFDVSLAGHTVSSSLLSLVTGDEVRPLSAAFVSQTAGIVSVSMTSTETSTTPPASYGWELRWIAPGGVKRVALSGVVEVTR